MGDGKAELIMGVKLKNALSSALSSHGAKLGSIICIGSGGPFNVEEGNSSLFMNLGTAKGKRSFLVDCGPMVYAALSRMGLINDIDTIVLTSSSEYSIGSLVTLVSHIHYYRSQNNGDPIVKVACAPHLVDRIKEYLLTGGLDGTMVNVSSDIDGVSMHFFETSIADSSFVLNTGSTQPLNIVHSGSINGPMFDKLQDNDLLYSLRADPSNVIVFHEASVFDDDSSCNYENLSEWSATFKNFFTFGHSKIDGSTMTFNERYMRSLSTSDGQNEFNIEKTVSL